MTLVSSTIDRLKPPDVRRDPREELRNMALRTEARGIFEKSLPPGVTLADASAPDPYDDSASAGRTFSVLRAAANEIVVLQIPQWIADDGRSAGALDETRYAFRGRTVRIISEGVHAPSLGLETLMDVWKANEKIDAGFVAWRRVEELAAGRHALSRALRVDALSGAATEAPVTRAAPSAGPKVFISYAHKNRDWYEKLVTQLAPLSDKYGGAIWSDYELEAGDDWLKKIVEALNAAPIVVLLISPYFAASKFIKAHEFGVALQAAKEQKKTLLWVYCTTCKYTDIGIGTYQAAHDIEKPLDQLPDGEQWAQLAKVYDSLAKALTKLER